MSRKTTAKDIKNAREGYKHYFRWLQIGPHVWALLIREHAWTSPIDDELSVLTILKLVIDTRIADIRTENGETN